MKLLVVNCNTSTAMTKDIGRIAAGAAAPGTEIAAVQPTWGPESAEGYYESFISAAAVLDLLTTREDPFDAVVMAGFGEHGRTGARQLLEVPVVDITEAAAQVACLLGHRFGVVTTMEASVAAIEESLLVAGLTGRCAGILASGLPVLELHSTLEGTAEALAACGRLLLERGADVLVLGCAGMAGMDERLQKALGVPVIDGVAAAVGLAETLVRLGKTTSKYGPYRPPAPDKARPGWPPSRSFLPATA